MGRCPATTRRRGNLEALGRLMVLVDTSVWICSLSDRSPFAAELEELLSRGHVSGHDFVFGELLIGDKGGRKRWLADYALMHQAPVVPHREVWHSSANDACTAEGSAG